MNKELKNLIYGKNDTKYIVSVEPGENDDCEIFFEKPGQGVTSEIVPNKRYIIFKSPMTNNVVRLKGNQPYKFYKEYSSNHNYYSALRQISKKGIDAFTIRNSKESFLCRYGYTYYKGLTSQDVSIMSIDIEDTYGINQKPDENGKLLLIANTYRKGKKIIRKQFAYDEYDSEALMLQAWAEWFRKLNPSIVLGHNLYGHDLKIIDFAAKKHKIRLKLGRNRSEMYISNRDSMFRKDGSQAYSYRNISIYGREIVDTWFLAMKYDAASRREYDNYKLKYIISYEGLEKKDRTHYDAANIHRDHLDPVKWEKIKKYNIGDSDDPLNYYDLVIPVFFQYTKSIPRSFQRIINSASGSQINSLIIRSYLQIGYSIAIPSDQVPYPGAISFGIPGIHRNVFKIDVQSLYPSIILTYKLIDRRKDPKGHLFKILKYFTAQRIKNKKQFELTKNQKWKILSDSQKIVINSVYGFLGAPRLNYNCPKIAAKVTEYGRSILMKAIEYSTGYSKIPENAVGGKAANESLEDDL